MGETPLACHAGGDCCAFSILERIDVGETRGADAAARTLYMTFSILERIDVGETRLSVSPARVLGATLSVSSNGSTWVKRNGARQMSVCSHFQYPRTDRRG